MERKSYNYDIKIITKDGIITYENEPLENIGKRAEQHPSYAEIRAVHRKVLTRNVPTYKPNGKPIGRKGK